MKVDIEGMIEIDLDDVANQIVDKGIDELAERIVDNIDMYDLAANIDVEKFAEHTAVDHDELSRQVIRDLDYTLLAESIVAHMSSDNLLTLIDELSAAHATMYRREEE
jgi:hypothetical protein